LNIRRCCVSMLILFSPSWVMGDEEISPLVEQAVQHESKLFQKLKQNHEMWQSWMNDVEEKIRGGASPYEIKTGRAAQEVISRFLMLSINQSAHDASEENIKKLMQQWQYNLKYFLIFTKEYERAKSFNVLQKEFSASREKVVGVGPEIAELVTMSEELATMEKKAFESEQRLKSKMLFLNSVIGKPEDSPEVRP
jgi:hypothetical protein